MAIRIWLLICLAIILFAYSSASAKVSGREVEYLAGDSVLKEIFAK